MYFPKMQILKVYFFKNLYLTYLVIIAKEVKIVKEVISCDVSPVAMF